MNYSSSLVPLIRVSLRESADWRIERADEYSEDKARNLRCAAQFLEMAANLHEFQGGPWHDRCVKIFGVDSDLRKKIGEVVDVKTARIDFAASDPEEFFEELLHEVGVCV